MQLRPSASILRTTLLVVLPYYRVPGVEEACRAVARFLTTLLNVATTQFAYRK